MPAATVMSADDIRRAITRIAHEIVERIRGTPTSSSSACARAACRSPGAWPPRSSEFEGESMPVGSLDFGLYRDDLPTRGPKPRVQPSDLPVTSTASASSLSTTCSTPAAPCGRRSTRSSTSAAQPHPARRPRRPRPPRAAHPRRLRRQEHPHRPHADDVQVRLTEIDGNDEVACRAPGAVGRRSR